MVIKEQIEGFVRDENGLCLDCGNVSSLVVFILLFCKILHLAETRSRIYGIFFVLFCKDVCDSTIISKV